MGQQFDRLAITLDPSDPTSKEYVVLETQLMVDFGQGQGPKGGVIRVENGSLSISGPGEAQLSGGTQEQGGNVSPRLRLIDDQGKRSVEIAAYADPYGSPSVAKIYIEGVSARLQMRDAAGNDHALLDGAKADLWLGGKAASGDVVLFAKGKTDNRNTAKAAIHLNGQASAVRMRDAAGNDHAFLDGAKADLWLGGKAASGDVVLFAKGETDNRNTAKATIRLNGHAGDIVLRNADCAEDFEIAPDANVEPGTVMAIDDHGRLCPTTAAYDGRVAGVVSGAGDSRPGIVLGRVASAGSRLPIALVGRVGCRVEAISAPIAVGDLLTSSSVGGHAMKAMDPQRAFGAVIGKALAPLPAGVAVIPILVGLH